MASEKHTFESNEEAEQYNNANIGNHRDTFEIDEDEDHHLQRGLKSRQVAMIAIGGAIGTGLIIGTGKALATAGPGSIFIGYTLVGLLCFTVMSALGEMAAWYDISWPRKISSKKRDDELIGIVKSRLPVPSAFTGYATRFVDPALGFATGWNYWFKVYFNRTSCSAY